jgi:hypothetical protein
MSRYDDTNGVGRGPAIRLMLQTPGIARRDIAHALRCSRQLVKYHADRLEAQGLVVRTGTTGRCHSVCTRPVVASKTTTPGTHHQQEQRGGSSVQFVEPLVVPEVPVRGIDPMDRDGRFNAGPTRCGEKHCGHYIPPEDGWSHFLGVVDDNGKKKFDHYCIGKCIPAVTVAKRLLSRHVRRTWLPTDRRHPVISLETMIGH